MRAIVVAEAAGLEFAAQETWEALFFPLHRSATRNWTAGVALSRQRSARPSWLAAEVADPSQSACPRSLLPAPCRSFKRGCVAPFTLAAVESSRDVQPAQEITPFVAMRNKRGHDAVYQSRLPA